MSESQVTLSSRERVLRCFDRKPHDRIPRHEHFWPDTIDRWKKEGHIQSQEDAFNLLQNDITRIGWVDPPVYEGGEETLGEDEQTRTIRDRFGATQRVWKGRSGTPEHIGWVCDSRESWEKDIKPRMLAMPRYQDYEALKRHHASARERDLFVFLAGLESFEGTRRIMGDETTLIAMAMDPDWIMDFSKTHTDLVLRELQAMLDAGLEADGVWMYGDMAFNHATMCSPAMYRELIWPDHKRLVDWAHEQGMKFLYHTDGDVRGVLDLYIEAGFDTLQPLEAKANMDVRELADTDGQQLTLFGNVDVMVMGTNDRDKIEAEVKAKIEAGKSTGSYIYHSDHSVPPSVDWETYQFIVELIDRYGNYE